MPQPSNDDIAQRLDEIGAILAAQSANPFRVQAYRRAADTLRRLPTPAAQILETHGVEGLDRLRRIGPSLARTIRDIVVHGYSPILERLRGEGDAIRLFASVPGIGPVLAARLHDELGLDTLPQLEAAACDGRLEEIDGFGPKRLSGIRDNLARRLGRPRSEAVEPAAEPAAPSVGEVFDVDREYREKVDSGALPRISPRRLNPRHEAWLPILHTERSGRHYTVLFSNTARAHRFERTHDWVVVFCDNGPREHQWTVITAEFGPLRGRRIVRGREAECAVFYGTENAGMPGIGVAGAASRRETAPDGAAALVEPR
jgi:DNA polymerase (family X)